MGSSYFGEPKSLMGGNERGGSSGSSSSSSRKGKKSNTSGNSSEKQPKQPQRGLGVAQLEKIRLTGQLGYNHHHHHPSSYHINPNYPSNLNHQEDIRGQTGYSSIPSSSFSYSSSSPMPSYAYNPNIMMGGGTDYDRSSMRYGDHHTQPTTAAPSWNHPGHSLYESRQPNAAKHLFNLHEQTTTSSSKKHRSSGSNGSSSQNSESSDSQELDLELRLSL